MRIHSLVGAAHASPAEIWSFCNSRSRVTAPGGAEPRSAAASQAASHRRVKALARKISRLLPLAACLMAFASWGLADTVSPLFARDIPSFQNRKRSL